MFADIHKGVQESVGVFPRGYVCMRHAHKLTWTSDFQASVCVKCVSECVWMERRKEACSVLESPFPYGDFINVPKRLTRSFERESRFTLAHSLKNTVPQGEGKVW